MRSIFMTSLLYLHGYNSSSQSKKALQTKHWIASNAPYVDFICPDLPPFADCAMKLLNTIVEARSSRPLGLIGSSMGGFFATCLIEKYDLRGVLFNPAVSPARGLESWRSTRLSNKASASVVKELITAYREAANKPESQNEQQKG